MDDEEYYNYFPISDTPETVEGITLPDFVVSEDRDTSEDYTPTEPGQWDNFWGSDSWDTEDQNNFWDSLTAAFDAGAGKALANVKKSLTPAQAAAAGKAGGASGGSSSKPNQTTTTTNTTNNFLTSPVAVLAMLFGGLYLLKIARK